MKYKSLNNQDLEKLLDFYKLLEDKLKGTGIINILYGSLSYAYFTNDENIDINDIDLIAPESSFKQIIELIKNERDVTYELTDHNSLRLLKNGAKLSIHSQKLALEISDFMDNLVDIEINGVVFKSLGLDDLIKFYKKGNDYEIVRKTGYIKKLKNLIEKKYWGNYTFFLLKPSILERSKQEEIKNYIIKSGFEIINEKVITLSKNDIEYIYEDEYTNLIPILGEENVNKAMEINKQLYSDKKCIFILAKSENAIKKADLLKGDTYWPAKCKSETIRYVFRDKQFDNFDMPKGKIVDVPCDNIVHCPKTFSEFEKLLIKWLI